MRNPNLAPIPVNLDARYVIDVLRNLNVPQGGLGDVFSRYVDPLATQKGIFNNPILRVASVGGSTAAVAEAAFLADQFGGKTSKLNITAIDAATGLTGFYFLSKEIAQIQANASGFPLSLDFRDGTDINTLPASFDIVMARNPNPSAKDAFIEGIINSSRPGGIIIITSAQGHDASQVAKNLNIVSARGVNFTRIVEDVSFNHPDPNKTVPNLDDRFWILQKDASTSIEDQATTQLLPVKSGRRS